MFLSCHECVGFSNYLLLSAVLGAMAACDALPPSNPSLNGKWVLTTSDDCSSSAPAMIIDGNKIRHTKNTSSIEENDLENVDFSWTTFNNQKIVVITFDKIIGPEEERGGWSFLMVDENTLTPLAGSDDGVNFEEIESHSEKLAGTISRCEA